MLPRLFKLTALACLASSPLSAQRASTEASAPKHPIVFFQPGFPTIASSAIARDDLASAIPDASFADLAQLTTTSTLQSASVLVLPYGSALPVEAFAAIQHFVDAGGNLLLLGGQPFRVPVTGDAATGFHPLAAQDSYSRALGFLHTYPAPIDPAHAIFHWRDGYTFLPAITLRPGTVYVEEGRLDGLGYLDAADGTHLASPVIVADHLGSTRRDGARIVALPFEAEAGFWHTSSGQTLLRTTTAYAAAGAVKFSIELGYVALRPAERPSITLHLRNARAATPDGTADITLLHGNTVLESKTVALGGSAPSPSVVFSSALPEGRYTLRATWHPLGKAAAQEFAENGFVVESQTALRSGPAFAAKGDFLQLGDHPFFPVGTNYFSTDADGWDFSGPRNGATWERDFADMDRHGVNFVRTGVWMPALGKFVEPLTGQANERFLRNLEGFLAAAHRHGIVVNFTCFAFTPHGADLPHNASEDQPPPNPYLDPATVAQEQSYVTSVVRRFRDLPFLSWDLINEPSFSNPRSIFHGNLPNNDPAERSAWHAWLRRHYGNDLVHLADAWRSTPVALGSFEDIPLPRPADLVYDRYGNADEVRALDYNLFAQDSFAIWVRGMVHAIRGTGSQQLINVGQDEGGVKDRLLNQFFADAGVGFTTNHTYWSDDALLWDSVVAKVPGKPNITGETGYQPAWDPDGKWRYDELTGLALEERKWVLGFAAGSSGAVQWDWDREVDFGMQRSDGSAKLWQGMMRDLGSFAKAAAPYATGFLPPETAIVLPQSLQLSVLSSQALAAQQAAVRTLYHLNRTEAYAVGEYQIDALGSPKLIILPYAVGLSEHAWNIIEAHVRAGAVLLLSGPFGADEHMHATDRAHHLGLPTSLSALLLRDATLSLPSGPVPLSYAGLKTTTLDKADLPGGATWQQLRLGAGTVLFSTYPLELNDIPSSQAAAYAVALQTAGIKPTYTTTSNDPGILICPTKLPHATLYVLSSETGAQVVSFTDMRSGIKVTGKLEAGRAALLLLDDKGALVAQYHWTATS